MVGEWGGGSRRGWFFSIEVLRMFVLGVGGDSWLSIHFEIFMLYL